MKRLRWSLPLLAALAVFVPSVALNATYAGASDHHGASQSASSAKASHALWYETYFGRLYLRLPSGKVDELAKSTSGTPVYSSSRHLLAFESYSGRTILIKTVTASGQQRDAFKCRCFGGVAWLGHRLAGIDGRQLVLRNVAAHTTHRITLHGPGHFRTGQSRPAPSVVSVVHEDLLIGAATKLTSAYGGPENLYRVTAQGRITSFVRNATGNVEIGRGVPVGNGGVAYVDTAHGGFCSNYNADAIATQGKIVRPTMPTSDLPWTVTSLRYVNNSLQVGLVNVPKSCKHFGSAQQGHATAHLYRVVGSRLVPTGQKYGDLSRSGSDSAALRGAGISSAVGSYYSALLLRHGHQPFQVLAKKVFRFSWL